MLKKVFSVFDAKAQAFLDPFCAINAPVALRWFTAAANDPQHDFYKFAEDYVLFELGEFDTEKGSFGLHAAPRSVAAAVAVKKIKELVK